MLLLIWMLSVNAFADSPPRRLVPVVDGPWIEIANNPEMGEYHSDAQQPVDFAVWQAANGKWQLWSCIRKANCGGKTRLFYRWESDSLTSPNWKPMGIAMKADTKLGENEGGMQAPHVIKHDGKYHLFYGDWSHICHAVSDDGVTFERVIQPDGETDLFGHADGKGRARDIMMFDFDGLWHGYYCGDADNQGAIYLRTTSDFKNWSEPKMVSFGGESGTGRYSSECPFVVERGGLYYLFRTQKYGPESITRVYVSDDVTKFGKDEDEQYLVTDLPIAAPEIVQHDGQEYLVATNLNLKGIRIAKLKWMEQKP